MGSHLITGGAGVARGARTNSSKSHISSVHIFHAIFSLQMAREGANCGTIKSSLFSKTDNDERELIIGIVIKNEDVGRQHNSTTTWYLLLKKFIPPFDTIL